jgi:hypothetical protein
MKFLSLFQKTKQDFTNIKGLDDVKNIIKCSLDCESFYRTHITSGVKKTIFHQ